MLASLLLAACAGESEDLDLAAEVSEQDEDALEAAGKADSLSSTSTFYSLRVDARRCIFPVCGGEWVARVNRASTRCAGGRYADECYVAEVENHTDLSEAEWADFLSAPKIVRGRIVSRAYGDFGRFGVLEVTEAWRAADDVEPEGIFYAVRDNGRRCFTYPCYSIHEAKLNSTRHRSLSGLAGRLGDKAGSAMVEDEKVIAAGHNVWVPDQGPAGDGVDLEVSQLYRRQEHVEDLPGPQACTTAADCAWTQYGAPVTSPEECYCPVCPTALLNGTVADAYRASWQTLCADVDMTCPLYPCAPPRDAACEGGLCVPADF